MSPCTAFCTSLDTLSLDVNTPLSRRELLQQLPLTENHDEWYLGIWSELQQRKDCIICQLVVDAIVECVQQTRHEAVDPEQPVNVLLFPDEVSFRLSFPSPLSARLIFISADESHAQAPDMARLIPREGVEISRIKRWLLTCTENHQGCSWRDGTAQCEPKASTRHNKSNSHHADESDEDPSLHQAFKSSFSRRFNEASTSNFRVIDIERGCIRPVPLDVRYIALSYVWGQSPMIKLQKANFAMLTREGVLNGIRRQLPNTIIDTIDLLRCLGERYLWVDGLCLIQDDVDDVSLGISMMNSIYHGSYFTVVAASGHDANSGLRGLREGCQHVERDQPIVELASGLRLTINHSIDWHLSHSIYNERGWTLQELVLPVRTLIFVDDQVYFRCREANWSEATWADQWIHWLDADDSNISRLPDPVEGFLPSCWAYQKLCEDFSRRKLRNDQDAMCALRGITRPMAAGMETCLVEGLPAYYLDHFILFVSTSGSMRRRTSFASFSWAGWDGPKMWPRENFEWPEDTTDGTVENKRQTEHIIRYFKHNRLVNWTSVNRDADTENLTSWRSRPSLLVKLMEQHSQLFDQSARDLSKRLDGTMFFGNIRNSMDIPDWESRSVERNGEIRVIPGANMHKTKGLPIFSIKALDLANSQAEFDKLLDRMTDPYARLAMHNWIACRDIRKSYCTHC